MSDRNLFDVSGRVACVTGASSGIGCATATMLAVCGARVVGVARRRDALEEWSVAAAGETATVAADLAQRDRIEDIAFSIKEPFGAADIRVNAAGVNTRQKADEVTGEGWDLTMELNLAAPFFLAQALVPDMKRRRWGSIVNLASLQSRRAFAAGFSSGVSKAGMEQLTRAMAEAWSKDGVMVNALVPGFFPTELTDPVFADAARRP